MGLTVGSSGWGGGVVVLVVVNVFWRMVLVAVYSIEEGNFFRGGGLCRGLVVVWDGGEVILVVDKVIGVMES